MAQQIKLRKATEADALCLSALSVQVYLDTYAVDGINSSIAKDVFRTFSLANFRKWLSSSSHALTVAEVNSHLVGFVHVVFGDRHSLAPSGNQSELLRLYVQERHTAQGIGSILLKSAEAEAFENGTEHLWLTPWVGNTRALRFYRKHGYIDFGQALYFVDTVAVENRVYSKALAHTA